VIETTTKKKNERIIKKKCPSCNHNNMFTSRGYMLPAYRFKCAKCKKVIKFE
jgi:transposase-like protein